MSSKTEIGKEKKDTPQGSNSEDVSLMEIRIRMIELDYKLKIIQQTARGNTLLIALCLIILIMNLL
jgi:hypothetical protein